MAATYKDIQRATGLSLSTISKYFNGKNVSDENHAAIQVAVEALDYRVNVFAQSLKSRRARSIGILIPELNSIFNGTIMSEVGHFLRRQGYGVLVCDCHADPQLEAEALEFLLDRQVDGLIIAPLNREYGFLQMVTDRKMPVVVVDRLLDDFKADTVVLDNWKAGSIAAEELIAAGHRDIGVITGEKWLYSMKERKWGFWRTLQRHGIAPQSDNFIHTSFTVEDGRQAALQLLQKKNRPTALFATNDLLTLGMVVAVQQLGLRVPEDVSLIGFDNLMIAQVLGKTLTMITQPYQELGEQAARFLLDLIERPHESKKRRVAMVLPIFHKGETVKDLRASGDADNA